MIGSPPRIVSFDSSNPFFAEAKMIRQVVFIGEQNCPPDEEWDESDSVATHLLAYVDGQPAGTLRYYDDGGWMRIGRVAVLPGCRGCGLAREMLRFCLDEGGRRGFAKAFLNAQADKVSLYFAFGFRSVGEEFMEAGIRHQRMELADLSDPLR